MFCGRTPVPSKETSLSSPVIRIGTDVVEASSAVAGPVDAPVDTLSPEQAAKLAAAAKTDAEKHQTLDSLQACCNCSLTANTNSFEAPVVASNGITYEAASINGRLDAGNVTDPNLSATGPLNPAVRYINRALIDAMADIKMRLKQGTTGRFESGTWKEPITGTCCPITLEPMTDPVIGPSGYSYERSALETLIGADGRELDPMTRDVFRREDLIPNTTLKNLIQQMTLLQGLTAEVSIKEGGAAAGCTDAQVSNLPTPGEVSARALLHLMMKGEEEQAQAQALLRAHPEALRELLTGRHIIKNSSNVEFLGVTNPDGVLGHLLHEGITPWEYLLWCEHIALYDVIIGNAEGSLGCLPRDASGALTEDGRALFVLLAEEAREVKRHGFTIRKPREERAQASNDAARPMPGGADDPARERHLLRSPELAQLLLEHVYHGARPTLARLYVALDALEWAAAGVRSELTPIYMSEERVTIEVGDSLLHESSRYYDVKTMVRRLDAYCSVYDQTPLSQQVGVFWDGMDAFWRHDIGGTLGQMPPNWRQSLFCLDLSGPLDVPVVSGRAPTGNVFSLTRPTTPHRWRKRMRDALHCQDAITTIAEMRRNEFLGRLDQLYDSARAMELAIAEMRRHEFWGP